MKTPAISTLVCAAVLVATTASSLAVPPWRRHPGPLPARGVEAVERAVQRRLIHLGYYNGVVDGIIGPHTRNAIRNYQADNRLPITGDIDPPLRRSLGV